MSAATAIRDEAFSPPPTVMAPAENWDDDFLFQAEDSPAKPPPSRPRNGTARQIPPEKRWSSHSVSDAAGAWDEELEREEAERQSSAGSSSLGPAAGAAVAPRTDLSRWAEPDEEDEEDFGIVVDTGRYAMGGEDTVSPLPVFSNPGPGTSTQPSPGKRARPTSPSRSSISTSASARSSPVMHTRQVPGSPALSLFSMSTSTAQQYTPSLASSTAHLRTTRSHETGTIGPFVPAQPRVPRRRLRKKSRPARPGDIAEHDDGGGGAVGGGGYVMREPSPPDGGLGLAMATEEEGSWSESSNQPQPQERTPSPPPMPVAGPSSPPTRTPLLTRIGSLKTKLGRRPKSTATPPSSYAPTSPTVPIPSTPARTRTSRSSTTPKQRPLSPETPNANVRSPRTRAPAWFRSASGTGIPGGSSPEEHVDTTSALVRRKSKEPFWRGVGSFSSSRSPAPPPSSDASEQDPKSDHEQTVKKPPRKSLSTTTRPPLPLPLPPLEAGSPTPGGGKLTKARRPMSLSGPAGGGSIKVGVAKVPASLGRGAGAGWASALGNGVEEGPEGKERGGVMRSLRRLSHSRKKSTGPGEDPGRPRIPSSTSTGPGSSVTTGSRVPSSSTVPSLHEWDGGRRPSGSVPKSASAIVLSSSAGVPREFDPSGSVFTLPIGFGEESDERDVTRQSLTVDFRSSTSRPSSPLATRPATPHAPRPSSPLATRRPSTPLHRPGTPLSGLPMTLQEEETPPPVPAVPNEEVVIVKEPVTPSKSHHLSGSRPIVFEDGVEFAIFTPEKPKAEERAAEEKKEEEEKEDAVPPVSTGRHSLSSGRTSGSIGSRSKIHRKSASLAHTKSASEPARLGSDLLPPIELQPPSPPQTLSGKTGEEHQSLLQLTTPPKSLANSLSGFTTPSSTPSKLTARLHHGNSPIGQSSSLSRAATQPGGPLEGSSVLRRNSLSDLKIPARISRAQSGLKSNLGMVREFAGSVEQIRRLQTLYRSLLADLKYAIENGEPLSPVLFPPAPRASATSATLVRVPSRDIGRVTDRLNNIDERYGLWWECADVIVELGGGGSGSKDASNTATAGDKSPVAGSPDKDKANGRERAITLAGNQAAPNVEPATKKEQWDKDRGELSPRQLQILREMLATPNPSLLHVPLPPTNIATTGYLNALHPGGTASAVTLPSSSASSSHMHGQAVLNSQSVVKLPEATKATGGAGKIRRASRAGINGIKDLLKHLNLKKLPAANGSSVEGSRPPTRMGAESRVDVTSPTVGPGSQSQINLGMQSQANLGHQSQVHLAHQSQLNLARQSQTHLPQSRPYGSRSHGPAATPVPVPVQHKSPRRPSLASIFRLNSSGRSKSKGRAVSASHLGSQTATSSTTDDDVDESDWDRMDSASDLDLRIKTQGDEKDATLRGRKSGSLGGNSRPPVPALPAQFTASKSQLSLSRGSPDEAAFGTGTDLASAAAGPSSGSSRFKQKTPSGLAQVSTSVAGVQPGLRSAPLQSPVGSGYPSAEGVEGRLALTPETIKPLLEYAREVAARLDQCVAELRELGMNDGEKLSV